jgi:hypothetical protein
VIPTSVVARTKYFESEDPAKDYVLLKRHILAHHIRKVITSVTFDFMQDFLTTLEFDKTLKSSPPGYLREIPYAMCLYRIKLRCEKPLPLPADWDAPENIDQYSYYYLQKQRNCAKRKTIAYYCPLCQVVITAKDRVQLEELQHEHLADIHLALIIE